MNGIYASLRRRRGYDKESERAVFYDNVGLAEWNSHRTCCRMENGDMSKPERIKVLEGDLR